MGSRSRSRWWWNLGGRLAGPAVLVVALVAGGRGARAGAESADSLEDALLPLITPHEGRVAVAVEHLATGEWYGLRADEPMPTASLVKLPVMVAAYRAVREGRVTLADRVALTAADRVPGSRVVELLSDGADLPLVDWIRMMIATSDNTATNLVVERIGRPATTALMHDLGLGEIRLNSLVYRRDTSLDPDRSRLYGLGSGTAAEFVRLLAMLHGGELESRGIIPAGSSPALVGHLLACDDTRMVPRELPTGWRCAHKTGAVSGSRTDAGLLLGPGGPVAYCILTTDNKDRRVEGSAAEDLAAACGREIAGYFAARHAEDRPTGPQPLAQGATGVVVEELQRTLNARLPAGARLGVDGDFGPATAAGVRAFQKEAGLPETGIVDTATWQALGTLLTADPAVPAPEMVNAERLPLAGADGVAGPPRTTAPSWVIVDAASGRRVAGREADTARSPASITKVMTALVVLRMAATDPGLLDEVITVSTRAGQETGSSATLRPGDRLSVREMLYGLMLPSGNDASVALGEHCGAKLAAAGPAPADAVDPLDVFIARMNATAAEVGLTRTGYRNTHGKTAPGHETTAAEIATLVRVAMAMPLFREIVATRQRGATIASTDGYRRHVVWKNTNRLLPIAGYSGVKTGTTAAAGCCLAAWGEHEGRELVVVVLGATSTDARYVDARNLFAHGWALPAAVAP